MKSKAFSLKVVGCGACGCFYLIGSILGKVPMQAIMNTSTLVKINELAVQVGKSLGLTVVNTRLSGHGKQKNLEICIYRPESAISFADCEAMSRNFEQILEYEEAKGSALINGPFNIDVVSPGIERRLTTAADFALLQASRCAS